MTSCQRHELIAPIVEERIRGHNRARGSVEERREGSVDLCPSRLRSPVTAIRRAPQLAPLLSLALVLQLGLTSTAIAPALGMSSQQIQPFGPQHELNNITPVALPPGRLRLATSPTLSPRRR